MEKNRKHIFEMLSMHGHEAIIIVPSEQNEEFEWKPGITVYRVKYKEKIFHNHISKYNLIGRICETFWSYAGVSIIVNPK